MYETYLYQAAVTTQPLVSVICLCYQQAAWVEEAVQSVINQSYKNIEIILIDDASHDASAEKITALKERYPSIHTILLDENQGNCKAFNIGLKQAKGKYVIDFAADDVMMAERIERQVAFFEKQAPNCGVIFTDAVYIDEHGRLIRYHYEHLFRNKLLTNIPEGDVYQPVLYEYFIASPTMMVRREVLDVLNGYDETLAYEDFDFWVRSARIYQYAFLNERLTAIRKTRKSMSTGWYKSGDRQLHSTYLVCRKAIALTRTPGDKQALIKRVRYELRQSVFSDNREEALLFYKLLKELGDVSAQDKITGLISRLPVRIGWLRRIYHRLRFGR